MSDSATPVMQEKKFGRFGILLKDIVKNTHKALQAVFRADHFIL